MSSAERLHQKALSSWLTQVRCPDILVSKVSGTTQPTHKPGMILARMT